MFVDRLQVGEDKLGVDDIDVGCGVDRGISVTQDIIIVECPDDMDDSVALADIGEKLITEAFTFGCTGDKPRDIDEGDGGRDDLLGRIQLLQHGQPLVRNRDDAGIGLDRGEWIIGRQCASVSQGVK